MIYDGIISKPPLDDVLSHHGIKGQRWGVQNGPPYPLDKGRKQTKYGFKGRGGKANAVKKALLKTAIIPGVNIPGMIGAAVAEAKEVRYKPGETTDRHYIKKGTKMYRVSSVDNENQVGETYVTYNPVDRAFYRAYIKSKNPGQKVYETTFKANQDLVVPSQKELAEVQKKVIWDNPKLKKQSIEGFTNFRSFGEYEKQKIGKLKDDYNNVEKKLKTIGNPDKVKFDWDIQDGKYIVTNPKTNKKVEFDTKTDTESLTNWTRYGTGKTLKDNLLKQVKNEEISTFSVVSLSMGTSKELKQAMIKELKSRGYNSMVDEAGIGALEVPGINDKKSGRVSREGVEPIIVFDRSESLKVIKTKEVKDSTYYDDISYYNRWRAYKDNAYRKITW